MSVLDGLGEGERALLRAADAGFVEPMLATLTTDHSSDPDWIFERKFDGMRAVAVRDGGGARLFSRNRKPASGIYPELVDALAAQAPAGLVADGEIVAFEGAQTSFSRLQGRFGIRGGRGSSPSGPRAATGPGSAAGTG